jgi:hypothetical protein
MMVFKYEYQEIATCSAISDCLVELGKHGAVAELKWQGED